MMKSIAFASTALFGLALATGAAAADSKDSVTPGVAATPAAQPEKGRAADPKICVVDTLTGSRIAKKVCKTRSEWMVEGVDPLNL
jgi:hypothetical protein